MLRLSNDISVNEFIVMLRDRFFPDLELEDIWLYRLIQVSEKGDHVPQKCQQSLAKFSYSLELRHDIPMFTKSPTVSHINYEKNKKLKKERWSNRQDTIYVYLTINPAKSR